MPAAEAAPAGVTVTVVRGALNSPRHLTLTPAGLVVAEAGAGGTDQANCVTGPNTTGTGTTQYCAGLTGAAALIAGHGVTPSVPLPSVIEQDSQEVAGPGAVAFGPGGAAVVLQDVLVNKDGANPFPGALGNGLGRLLVWQGRSVESVNLAAFAAAHPQSAGSLGNFPGETAYDSDPYDVWPTTAASSWPTPRPTHSSRSPGTGASTC